MTRRRILFTITIVFLVAIGGIGGWLWFEDSRPPERSVEALCQRLAGTSGLDAAIATLDPTRLGPLTAALEQSVEVAPTDIAAQLRELATFVREVTDAVRAEPLDKRAALAAALDARQDRVDSIGMAGRAVESWNARNCGSTLRSTTTSPRTTTTRR